jgi:hypothetical protein
VEISEDQDGNRSEPLQVARHLDFRLFWEELPVLGPGAQVRLTAEDDITERMRLSRLPTAEGELPIITADEAYRLLLRSEDFRKLEEKQLRIFRRCLGYYSLPPRDRQDCLIPVYAFEGVCSTDALRDHHFVRYVQAVKEEVRMRDFPEDSVMRTMRLVFP